jgi:hypothetical protein
LSYDGKCYSNANVPYGVKLDYLCLVNPGFLIA